MKNPLERILAALRERGYEPKQTGSGWVCRCPGHDDRNPSLSINAGDDKRALVNCHAGCSVDAVCSALGINKADLFPEGGNGYTRGTGRGSVTVTKIPRKPGCSAGSGDGTERTFPTAQDAVAELERRHGPRSATWTYHNAVDDPVGQVVRWNTPDLVKRSRARNRERRTVWGGASAGCRRPALCIGCPTCWRRRWGRGCSSSKARRQRTWPERLGWWRRQARTGRSRRARRIGPPWLGVMW